MVFQGLGVYKDVVDVSSSELSHVLENKVYGFLKCRRGIAQPEWHDLVRKCAILGPERGAFDVFGKYPNLMKA